MSDLTGRVVLVTGASSGLGEAVGEACTRAGCCVVLAARRVDRLAALERRLGCPDRTLALEADVSTAAGVEAMTTAVLARFGRIDVLVANAGVGRSEPFAECTEERMLWQLDVNALGVIRCVRAVLPGMLERGSGHILTVSSVAAEIQTPGAVVYGASKGAVHAFTEGLYRELRPCGIHVTEIVPGFIRTEMTASVPVRMPAASVVGDLVVSLLRRPRRRAVIPRYYGAAIWLNRFFPGVVDWGVRRMEAELARRGS